MDKLPILPSIRKAITYTYMNVGLISKVAAPWVALYLVYTLVFEILGIADYLQLAEDVDFVTNFPIVAVGLGYENLEILTARLDAMTAELGLIIPIHYYSDHLLKILAYASVSVAMVRVYILDVELPIISLKRREIKNFIYIMVFLIIIGGASYGIADFVIPANIGTTATGMLYTFIGLFVGFFVVRFLLVFPAIALDDDKISIMQSWQLTRGINWRLYGGMILVLFSSLPISLFKLTVDKVALPLTVIWPIELLFSMMIVTFIAVYLAVCYQYIVLGIGKEKQGPLF